jgi:hypothetical protein
MTARKMTMARMPVMARSEVYGPALAASLGVRNRRAASPERHPGFRGTRKTGTHKRPRLRIGRFHDPTGTVINHPTNVTWGGPDLKDLYVGSIRADYVLKARSPVAGQPLVHQL